MRCNVANLVTTVNRFRHPLRYLPAALLAAALAGCATPPPPPATPLQVKILAINDFHGNLKTPANGLTLLAPRSRRVAGGAEHMATLVAELRAKNPNSVFVAAGDLIGATPLLSALLHDEPTIEALTLMGLEVSAMGNHELDRGQAELMRLQNGGCHPKDGCKGSQPFKGAGFKYLAANTDVELTGKTLLPPYWIKRFEGVPVAFVGMTTRFTPSVVAPAGTAGLKFRDEAATVNALVPELRRQGVETIVVLLHEGGSISANFNDCTDINGPIVEIVKKLDKAIDVVISGHSHRAYNCVIDGRVVTSAESFGTLVTQIDLTIDRSSRDVVKAVAENLVVAPETYAKDPAMTALLARYEQLVAPLAKRRAGLLSEPLPAGANKAGESLLGRLIADAQLEATRSAGAQMAFMNPGGVRSLLGAPGRLEVTYEDLFAVQPFYNQLVTMTLSGAQIVQLLNRQYRFDNPRALYPSSGFSYTWDAALPVGERVLPGSVMLNGKALDPAANYRVTVNSFLADGGDNNAVLRQGTERTVGVVDIDALEAYFLARPLVKPDVQPRVTRLN
jgi:5'-nucleotidase